MENSISQNDLIAIVDGEPMTTSRLVFNFPNEMQNGGGVLWAEAFNFFQEKMFVSRFSNFFVKIGFLTAIFSFLPKTKNVIRCNVNKQLVKRFPLNFSYFFDALIFIFRKSNLSSFIIILLCQIKNLLTLNLVSYNISIVDTNFSVFLKGGQQ